MRPLINYAILAFPSIIVIINPILVTSMFITLAGQLDSEARNRIIRRTVLVSAAVLLTFAVSGTLIFKFFSITIGAFQIAGGVILFTVAIGMLHAMPQRTKQTPEEMEEARTMDDIAVVPLAIPMVSGPGAITTVIVLAGEAQGGETPFIPSMIMLIAAILAAMLVVYIMMAKADRIQRFLGPTGLNITTRIMGLILAAIAVQFIINGIEGVLPEFAKVLK